ncbi:hypothetical protein [Bosea sp. (in: a-proteobacteria)]|uniref:hypothetical protein n=1 Tax=Bosea sp. (in: a-proteobacteria) TaxID=1871050 RepID=UPI003B3BAB61
MVNGWETTPRLVPEFLRFLGDAQHFIAVHFFATLPPEKDPYAGIQRGKKARTQLENELDLIQACMVADLECVLKALYAVEMRKNATRRRKIIPPTLDAALQPVILGPSSIETLLNKGRRHIREREANCDAAYRGYLMPARAARLAAIDDAVTLDGLKDALSRSIHLAGCARNAAQATAKGFRATLIEFVKGKRRSDRTISRDMLDTLPQLSVMEMILLSFVSGVNASHIWQCYHGAPATIDYHRVFDLAVFGGRLTRGEPAPITWDLARYLELHVNDPNINRSMRVLLFPNTVQVHHGLDWICAAIEKSCDFEELKAMLLKCNQPGQSGTLRLPPLMPQI